MSPLFWGRYFDFDLPSLCTSVSHKSFYAQLFQLWISQNFAYLILTIWRFDYHYSSLIRLFLEKVSVLFWYFIKKKFVTALHLLLQMKLGFLKTLHASLLQCQDLHNTDIRKWVIAIFDFEYFFKNNLMWLKTLVSWKKKKLTFKAMQS